MPIIKKVEKPKYDEMKYRTEMLLNAKKRQKEVDQEIEKQRQ